jgi:N-acetylmuramic acid 6-phosphate etherase
MGTRGPAQAGAGAVNDNTTDLDRGNLDTERVDPRSSHLDELPTAEALALFARADREAAAAVEAAGPALAAAVDLVADRLARGGRLLYVGAGTSGRLGALDASECPPTFHSAPDQVTFLIAGGTPALTGPVEGAEDDAAAGARGVADRNLGRDDAVLGISAGGTTPFVHGALAEARRRGAATLLLACVPRTQAPAEVDVDLRLLTGPELLAGSTRLKAGTATKLALNALSTLVMARLGKVHGNLMVDLDTRANTKLVDRATRILIELTGLPRAAAAELLERADGRVKIGALMHLGSLGPQEAERRLAQVGGHLRRALAQS